MEIHDALLPDGQPFRLSMETVWARAEHVTANGRVVMVPHPMHQLWHACVHFAWSHEMQWGSWRTFRDTTAIVATNRIDWTEFIALARETRASTCCFWTLRLTRRLTGASVPGAVLDSLRPPYPEFIVNRLERHLLASLFPSRNRCPSVLLTRRLWEVAIAPAWSGHGDARPWQVSAQRLASVERVESQPPRGRAITDRLRKISAGCAYLLRVSRLALPVDFVEPRAL